MASPVVSGGNNNKNNNSHLNSRRKDQGKRKREREGKKKGSTLEEASSMATSGIWEMLGKAKGHAGHCPRFSGWA